mmetsp:Transcript_9666/g.14618  ORF Transcript_9666/g.14618 Transcript_9666/m.14618 type:complete len:210 (-) Transcript_9666:463-1092(-)
MRSCAVGLPVSFPSSAVSSTAPPPSSSSPSFSTMPSSARICCHASFSACFSALDLRPCFPPSPPCVLLPPPLFPSLNTIPCFFIVLMIPARLAEKLSTRVVLDNSNNRFAAATFSSRLSIAPSCSNTSASNLSHLTLLPPSSLFAAFTVTHCASTRCTVSSKVSATFLESRTSRATVCSAAFCCVSDATATILEPLPFLFPFLPVVDCD